MVCYEIISLVIDVSMFQILSYNVAGFKGRTYQGGKCSDLLNDSDHISTLDFIFMPPIM